VVNVDNVRALFFENLLEVNLNILGVGLIPAIQVEAVPFNGVNANAAPFCDTAAGDGRGLGVALDHYDLGTSFL
jgi:hypothetical protein